MKIRQLFIAIAVLLAGSILTAAVVAQEPTPLPTISDPILEWNTGNQGVRWAEIRFDDLAPDYVSLQQCWNGMGMDAEGRIYIGFTSDRRGGGEDFAVFRYDPANGEKSFLGTFMDAAQAADNLHEGESIPKGHTRMIYADGVMFMGSQSFHDFKQEIDDLPDYRGAHLFAFDTTHDTWQDLAARLPDGVILENQGIVALGILRDQHLLVGLAHPHSDIVLFDYETNTVSSVIPGIPWELGNPLSREVIIAPSGRIFTYRGTEDPIQRNESHSLWVYDLQTDLMTDTGYEMTQGFWVGQTETRDGSTIYVSTVNGQLYAFDTVSETFSDLGYLLPQADYEDGRRIRFVYGVTLSPDETELYYIPVILENPEGYSELYSFDLETGEVSFVQQMPRGIYTAADLRDEDNIYLAHFGSNRNFWSGDGRLMVIDAESLP